jgi:hypothetical protein
MTDHKPRLVRDMKLFSPITQNLRSQGIKYSLDNLLFWRLISDTLGPLDYKLTLRPKGWQR